MEMVLLIILICLGAISLIFNFVLLKKKSSDSKVDVLAEQKKLFSAMSEKNEQLIHVALIPLYSNYVFFRAASVRILHGDRDVSYSWHILPSAKDYHI